MFWLLLLGGIAGPLLIGNLAKRQQPLPTPAGRAKSLGDIAVGVADEGRALPIVYGTETIEALPATWYGDYFADPIKERGVITGYRYQIGLDLGISEPVNAVTSIKYGTGTDAVTLWAGEGMAGSLVLAEGEWLEGDTATGAFAQCEIHTGESGQEASPYMLGQVDDLPTYAGVAHLVWRGPSAIPPVANTSPWAYWRTASLPGSGFFSTSGTLKPLAVTVRNTSGTYDPVGDDANPANILRALYTRAGGDLYVPSEVGTLFPTETHGYSATIDAGTSIAAVVEDVLRQTNCIIRKGFDGGPALFAIRPTETYTEIGDEHIIEMQSVTRAALDEQANTVEVAYRDRAEGDKVRIARAQDTARALTEGAVVHSVQYMGCRNAELAAKLAARDLHSLITPALRLQFSVVSGLGYPAPFEDLQPGDPVRVSYSAYGIAGLPCRVLSVRISGENKQACLIDCIEDVFSTDGAAYTIPPALSGSTDIEPAPPAQAGALICPPALYRYDTGMDHVILWATAPDAGGTTYRVVADSSAELTPPAVTATPDLIGTAPGWAVFGTLEDPLAWDAGWLEPTAVPVILTNPAHLQYIPNSGWLALGGTAVSEWVHYKGYGNTVTAEGAMRVEFDVDVRGALGDLPLAHEAALSVLILHDRPLIDPAPHYNASRTATADLGGGNWLYTPWYHPYGTGGIKSSRYRFQTVTNVGVLPLDDTLSLPFVYDPEEGEDTVYIGGETIIGAYISDAEANRPTQVGGVSVHGAYVRPYETDTGTAGFVWDVEAPVIAGGVTLTEGAPNVSYLVQWLSREGLSAPCGYRDGGGTDTGITRVTLAVSRMEEGDFHWMTQTVEVAAGATSATINFSHLGTITGKGWVRIENLRPTGPVAHMGAGGVQYSTQESVTGIFVMHAAV